VLPVWNRTEGLLQPRRSSQGARQTLGQLSVPGPVLWQQRGVDGTEGNNRQDRHGLWGFSRFLPTVMLEWSISLSSDSVITISSSFFFKRLTAILH